MRTALTAENPYRYDRYGYLWEALKRHGGSLRHLDYGTFNGAVPATLCRTGLVEQAVGVDLNAEALAQAPDQPGLTVTALKRGEPLPFADGEFTSASLLDVIEHVADQDGLLGELARVLVPGGLLVVTAPRQHILSFLDTGNLKFRFPRAHRAYYARAHGQAAYQERYVVCANGLIGDIEVEKSWHEHFTEGRLASLLSTAGFEVVDTDGAGLLHRLLLPLKFVVPAAGKPALRTVMSWDERAFASTHLFCTAVKIGPGSPAGRDRP